MNSKKLNYHTFEPNNWQGFINENFFGFDMESVMNEFIGDISIVEYDDQFRAAFVKSSPQEISVNKKNKDRDYFYIVSSANDTSWRNRYGHGRLKKGGLLVFDCQDDFSCLFSGQRDTTSFLLPYKYLGNQPKLIDKLRKQTIDRLYSNFILELALNLDEQLGNDELYRGILAISNLLLFPKPVIIDSYKRIFDYIKDNVSFRNLDLKRVAVDLGLSQGEIKQILSQSNTSFHQLVKECRVTSLRESIDALDNRLLSTLCYENGFNSIHTAIRHFKEYYRVTPSEYREEKRLYHGYY
ncbi:helix-turn-helix domain-containing protein [Photobacterium damselae]|uniref:helix-turn-helix domain-containing protein n=1 Tax=Photobacterium damselae TaxID=38293 RepID=UPI001EFD561A|nr:AraC family transcriptional regulator [Photobacterium damselae]MCG9780360.1 AraC family transcriptional regulator [Photobacterium damselae]